MKFTKQNHKQITSYYHERLSSPTYLSVIIPFGTIHEMPNQFGISHLVEHLLCRETAKYPNLSKLKSEIAKRGMHVNAHVALDHTRIHIGVPSVEDFDFATDLLHQMLYSQKYYTETLEIEKKSIQSEIAILKSNPARFVYSELYRKLFGLNNGQVPNYGSPTILQGFTLKDVDAQFKHLSSLPIVVLGAGAVNSHKFHEKIFANIKSPGDITKSKVVLKNNTFFETVELKNGDRLTLGCIFAVNINNMATLCAMDLISEYIGNYMFGTITQKLRDESGETYYVDSSHAVYGDQGYLIVCTNISKTHSKNAEGIILDEISQLAKGIIDPERLEIVRKMILKRAPIKLEQSSGEVIINERLKSYINEENKDYTDYLDVLKDLTLGQIVEAANKLNF